MDARKMSAFFCRRSVEDELPEEFNIISSEKPRNTAPPAPLQTRLCAARLAIGRPELVRQQCRDARRINGVTALDPITLVGVPALLLLVTIAGCLIPAGRAARIDPMTSLRSE